MLDLRVSGLPSGLTLLFLNFRITETCQSLVVMSINEGEIDLDLATSSNNSSGAGVNANSRVDMGFAVSDPISELVWSPHNGLRLKCADSALDDKKSIPTWNLMPSTKCLSASLSVRPMRTGEVRVGENKLTLFQNVLKRENRSVDCDSSMSSAQQFEGAQVIFIFIRCV